MKYHDSLKYIQLYNLFGRKKICPKIFSKFSMFNANEKIAKKSYFVKSMKIRNLGVSHFLFPSFLC
jgi:hypothetical protein